MSIPNPTPGFPVFNGFGPREPIQTPEGQTLPFHYGVDRAAPEGTPILASLPGRVIVSGEDNSTDYEGLGIPRWPGLHRGWLYGGGFWIFIQSSDLVLRYMHLRDRPTLKVGDMVTAGQIIGHVGDTGVSTGPHLHQESLRNGRWVDPLLVDPAPYLYPSQTPSGDDPWEDPLKAIYYMNGKEYRVAIFQPLSGFWSEYTVTDYQYNNKIASGLGTGNYTEVTKSHFETLKADCAKLRQGK